MNEKKKMKGLPKRILSFVLTLTMILTLLPISSTIVYADTLQIPNDATIIEEDYRKDDAGSFYLYLVDENGNEELYGELFYDRFVSMKTIMLSTDIKSVRLVKGSGYEVNLDQLTLNGIAPNGFERKLSKTDKDLIELENVLTFELQGKGNLVISARAPKTVSDESLAVKFPNSNFMKTITMDSECYTYDMDSNVCTLSNVKIVPDKSNLFKSVIAYPGSGHPVAPIDYYVANDDDYLYIYSEVFGDNTLDHGKDHSGIYVLCDDEVKYYAVYTTEENEYGYWDFTYTNSRLEYDYQHMTYLVKIPRTDILDAGNSVKLVFEYYGTLSGHWHEWEFRSEGAKIIATCNGWGECDANNGEAEILLIAESQNYSGDSCSFSKADIFSNTNFETFNNATENNLSVSDIKIYATDDAGNKTGSDIDTVTSKGQYIAELEYEIPDYSTTHSASICNEEHGYGPGVIEIKKVWGSWWTSKGDTAGYCSLQEGDRIESLNINLSGGGEVYLDNVALTEGRDNVSAKIVKLDGDKIYLCTNHDASVNNICATCGYGDKLNPIAKIVFDVTQNHAHGSWTYQTDGATLTATCGVNGCELPNSKVSLTLTATSQNYSGSAVTASYGTGEADAWEAAGLTVPTITYEAKDGSKLTDGKAVNAGNYTAKATVNDGTTDYTATVDFTITRPTSGGSSAPTITVPVTGNENSVKVSASVSGSTATVKTMTDAELNKVTGGEAVEIDLTGLKKDIDTAKIPTATVEKIAEQGGMSVKLSTATVTFDKAATQEIASQADGSTIQLVVDDIKTVSLNAVQKEAVGKLDTALIIDAYLVSNGVRLCTEGKGGFGGGKATVALPYEIKGNRTAANYSVYYVDDAGKLEKLNASYDADAKAFVFDIEHFSNYVVAYDENACPKNAVCPIAMFIDAKPTEWYHDGVHFCLENGYMNGVGNDQFAPNGTLSRAMIVTMLWRMEGEPVVNYAMSFKDVKADQWYTEAIRWAQSNKIVEGYNADSFGPDDDVTREQLATILYRYAQSKGEGFTGSWMFLLDFVDRTDISSWADEAVHWCSMKGIVGGKDGKVFDPQGNATRAEAAAMLQRYCEAFKK